MLNIIGALGRLRVRRMVRVTIQVALKSTACNIKRWLRAARHQQEPQGGATEPTWATLIIAAFQITRIARPHLPA